MQNFKVKNRMSVSLLLLLTALFVCFNPGYAFADLLGCMQSEAGQGIFKTMACKITTTLFDIRKIVYILGGFGLIAFTFAAIFNKISFKHLANIALSLFLLSMVTPFIEYFTQAPGAKLTYGSFLQPDFTEADYSMTFGECEGGDCPVSTTVAGGAVAGGSSGGGLGGSGGGLGGGLTTGSDNPIATAGTEVDTRTGWQKFKDGIKTVAQEGLKAYNTASSVISAAGSVYNAVDSTVKGVQGVDGIKELSRRVWVLLITLPLRPVLLPVLPEQSEPIIPTRKVKKVLVKKWMISSKAKTKVPKKERRLLRIWEPSTVLLTG